MFIRYMADTGTTPLGRLALEYLPALMQIAPVRLGSMSGDGLECSCAACSGGSRGRCFTPRGWMVMATLLTTPIQGDFINVVCCDPKRWRWVMTMNVGRGERASTPVDLYTAGHRNVLLTDAVARADLALKYEAIVVPSEDARIQWEAAGAENVHVIEIPVVDHDAFLRVIVA
jgi:hypothetical protein